MAPESGRSGVDETQAGFGSELTATATLRQDLIRPLRSPCPDFARSAQRRFQLDGTYREINSIAYTGADIVPEFVAANAARYGVSSARDFRCLNLQADPLPSTVL